MVNINGVSVGKTGYGMMGLTTFRPVPITEEEAFKALKAALANGATFWNGGSFYGTPENNSLTLLNKYFTKYPEDADKVVLSIKGSMKPDMSPDGTPEGIRRDVLSYVKALGTTKKIDIYECARVDPSVPVETTIRALAELVKEGVIGGIGLSEASAATIRRAHKVHPISAVEVEVSLWFDGAITQGIAEACAELQIPLIAYSPIGRGFLTGELKKPEDIPEGDFRRHVPRFQGDAFYSNLKVVEILHEFANKKGCTPAQLAISWVRSLSGKPGMPEILPLPGACSPARIEENSKEVEFTKEEDEEIAKILKKINEQVVGERYPGQNRTFVEV